MACNSIGTLHLLCSLPTTCNNNNNKSNLLIFNLKPSSTVALIGRRINNRTLNAASSSSSSSQVDKNDPEEIISGEWPENFSLLNYDDLRAFLEPEIFKDEMNPSALLGEVMSPIVRTATVDQRLEDINYHFEFVSGLPVIDEQFKCIGVISKKDRQRAFHGPASTVSEVMSSPAITLSPDKTVLDAAALMLKVKIHRIPIVNEEGQLVGIVTRSDIFKVLEGLPA